MISIRTRLFIILLVSTGLVWLSAVGWIYFNTRAQVEQVLDARLTDAARMVSSLLASQAGDAKQTAQLQAGVQKLRTSYNSRLSCQIWAFDGTLLGRSDDAPAVPLAVGNTGFSETSIDGERWRVYAVENKETGMRVLVGDSLRVRDDLVGDVIKGLLVPALLILPILTALIWLSLRQGLAPLNRMARALSTRDASDLSPLSEVGSSTEIRPVIRSLNGLFGRVGAAREHERTFTAFAAHELRTPIAGLKTQAQIALRSGDEETRQNALKQVAIGVDRTSRLIRQLTDLTAAEASEAASPITGLAVGRAIRMLGDELEAQSNYGVKLHLDPTLRQLNLPVEPGLFMLAARNLLENALLHSPSNGVVCCSAKVMANRTTIFIDDDGPGIPVDELPKVKDRFFRGRNKTPVGSGLGLAIAELALARCGGSFELANRPGGGLRAALNLRSAAPIERHDVLCDSIPIPSIAI